jgi:hypothetical protein
MSAPGANGWTYGYEVRRDDGEHVTVEAAATETSIAVAATRQHAEGLAFATDKGEAAALRYAEAAQSPAERGSTFVRVALDPFTGGLTVLYEYERPLPTL